MTSTKNPADRIIARFLRKMRQHDWSDRNLANACWTLNRVHDWLGARDATLLHDDISELVELLDDFLAERKTQVARSSVLVDHRQLAAFYRWASAEQADGGRLIARNPMRHIDAPKIDPVDPDRTPVAAAWQYDALLATTRGRKTRRGDRPVNDRRDAAIIALLWHTGMRRSEVAAIDFDRLDFDREAVYLPRTKGGRRAPKSRWVPIPEEAMEILDRYIDERGRADGPLFTSATRPGRRLAPDSIHLMLGRRAAQAAAALGVPVADVWTPAHSFRRAAAIDWLANGGSETGLMRNHGWSTRKMINEYTEPARDELTAAEARRMATARATRHLRAVN